MDCGGSGKPVIIMVAVALALNGRHPGLLSNFVSC